MKHYQTPDGHVWSFDVDQMGLVTPDMVELSDAQLAALRAPPARTRDQIVASVLTEVRALRSQFFEIADNLQGTFLTQALLTGDHDNAAALETYKEGLRNITQLSLTGVDTEQGMRDAFNSEYKVLRNALPNAVKVKFYQTLQ